MPVSTTTQIASVQPSRVHLSTCYSCAITYRIPGDTEFCPGCGKTGPLRLEDRDSKSSSLHPEEKIIAKSNPKDGSGFFGFEVYPIVIFFVSRLAWYAVARLRRQPLPAPLPWAYHRYWITTYRVIDRGKWPGRRFRREVLIAHILRAHVDRGGRLNRILGDPSVVIEEVGSNDHWRVDNYSDPNKWVKFIEQAQSDIPARDLHPKVRSARLTANLTATTTDVGGPMVSITN